MKTAISLPDDIFEAAEELAHELGVPRSHLYAQAVAEYIASHRSEAVTAKLNEIYGQTPAALDPELSDLQAHSVARDEW